MESSDPQHFFETDVAQAKREKRAGKEANVFGDPIRMPSKVLAVIPDLRRAYPAIFTAESSGRVSGVNLETRSKTAKYVGPITPVTCLAIGGKEDKTIFAGSWDKCVWSWDISTKKLGRKYDGHSDFVKAVVCARFSGKEVLISGGADKKIIVWDIETGKKLQTLLDSTSTMMSLQSLAIDPVLTTHDEITLVSASSDPHIRRWRITVDGYTQLAEVDPEKPNAERLTIQEHETSVYKLLFDEHSDEVDLWTASADGTTRCLSREKGFVSDDVFEHGNFVRAIAVTDSWVITGGISQDIKIWDKTSGKLFCTIESHFDEITELLVLRDPTSNSKSDLLCSASIDRSIRTWPLDKKGLDEVVEKIQAAANPIEDDQEEGKKKEEGEEKLMTAEEEAELAELMDED